MKKIYIPISILLALIIFIHFFIKPYLYRKSAVKIVEVVLAQWQNRDLVKAIDQWVDKTKYPIIYNVSSYKIFPLELMKKKGVSYAIIPAVIYFESGNQVIPSGKTWIFKLKYTGLGWKIQKFYLAELGEPIYPEEVEKPKYPTEINY